METYPVTLEGLDAAPTLRRRRSRNTARSTELPHLDGLVQTATDKVAPIRRKRNTVDAVLVPVGALETLRKVAPHIPDTDTLVQGSGSNKLLVGRDSNSRDTIFNREDRRVLPGFNVPKTDGSVATAGRDSAAVAGEVKTVDVLFVAMEGVANSSRLDVPDLYQAR